MNMSTEQIKKLEHFHCPECEQKDVHKKVVDKKIIGKKATDKKVANETETDKKVISKKFTRRTHKKENSSSSPKAKVIIFFCIHIQLKQSYLNWLSKTSLLYKSFTCIFFVMHNFICIFFVMWELYLCVKHKHVNKYSFIVFFSNGVSGCCSLNRSGENSNLMQVYLFRISLDQLEWTKISKEKKWYIGWKRVSTIGGCHVMVHLYCNWYKRFFRSNFLLQVLPLFLVHFAWFSKSQCLLLSLL